MRSFDWNKILTLNKEYLSDKQIVEQAEERGEEVPDWDKVAQTTVWERWAYYLYYNGVNNYSYVPAVIQNLATMDGWDPTNGAACDVQNGGPCVIQFGAGTLNVTSMVLFSQGISFFVQSILLPTIGALADYGSHGPKILLWITLISCAAQIGFLGFNSEGWTWWIALIVGIVVYVTYGASLVFYAAIFPRLSLNDPKVRTARREGMPPVEYSALESITRNHYSTISTTWSNIGFLLISVILIGVFQGLANLWGTDVNSLPNYSLSIASAVCGGFWLVCAIPWFFIEKKRPGVPLPSDQNYLTQGWVSTIKAFKECKRLPQTFWYLLGYFVLADAVNTTGQVVSAIQNQLVTFSGSLLTFFGLVQAIASIVGCLVFLYVQKYFNLKTKTMLQVSNVFTLLIPVWGCIGLGSQSIGFHDVREMWVYQVWFGIFTAPFYAYTQTVMSELIPQGKENMFFALFGIANKVSSFIGPTIIAAIINATNNQWSGFPICVFLQLVPICIIWRVNMKKAALDIKMYEEEERQKKLGEAGDGDSSGYMEDVNEQVEKKYEEKTEEFY
ncbi:autophagy-related protein 22-like protein [Umbelopsis sp. PMI_123]|nr:autophagy-related protein 22-like protein [Umbelopsis sp. PMI_123]